VERRLAYHALIKQRYERWLLSFPTVQYVSVSREGIVVGVKDPEVAKRIPDTIEGVPVIKRIGEVKLLAMIDRHTERLRPIRGGISIGSSEGAGTLSCAVWRRTSEGLMGPFGLSCNHVLNPYAFEGDKQAIGAPILQPGPGDGGSYPDDVVGYLYDFVPMAAGTIVTVDAAIFLPIQGGIISDKIVDVNITPMTPRDVNLGEGVYKVGRTTGLTYGEITDTNVTLVYEEIMCRDCFAVTSDTYFPELDLYTFAWAGDSGSLVLSDIDDKPLGLVFFGFIERPTKHCITFCCKAVNIERELNVIFALPALGPERGVNWTPTWIMHSIGVVRI
jgi:hypothetical protein